MLGSGSDDTTIKSLRAYQKGPLFDLQKVRNIEISHLTLDGDNQQTCTQGIEASNASHVSLHNLKITNLVDSDSFGPHGIYLSDDVTDSTIANCFITKIGIDTEWGAGIRIHHASHRNIIHHNRIDQTGRGGILCAASTDLKILNNHITKSGLNDGEGLGIELFDQCDRSVVEDNTLDHWLSLDTTKLVAVRRNLIGTKDGSQKWAGLELADSTNCIFTDNKVDGGSLVGISISNTETKEYVFWGRNQIRHCSMWGAQIQGESGGARAMYFYDNTFAETLANHPKSLYPGGFGFRINDNTNHITFERNRFENNQETALQIFGENVNHLSFFDNAIRNNAGDAISNEATPPSVWRKNSVYGNGGNNHYPDTETKKTELSFVAPNTATIGQAIQFQVNPKAGSHFLWDLGSGIPSNSPSPSYTYLTPGVRKITLLVWDKQGKGVRSEQLITILPKPAR